VGEKENAEVSEQRRFYGRRAGRRLRPSRRLLLETVLPDLRIRPPAAPDPLDVASLFPTPITDLWLEVGFGAGEHLAAQAANHPDIGFIGCEAYVDGVAALLDKVTTAALNNVRIYDGDARILLDGLPDACLGRVFILFSDPWPKKRHHRRRFIVQENLDQLARLMKDGAELRFASDHMEYVSWALERITAHQAFAWPALRPGDWRQRPGDGFATRYETKALDQGRACAYLSFQRLLREPELL
jgi:tRNA (guanine-N7-)-methyltransferase